jgi:WD40 repeat protein
MFTLPLRRTAGCLLFLAVLAPRLPAEEPAADRTVNDALLTLQGPRDCVYSVAFDADGGRVASASKDNLVKVWDARTGRDVAACKGHEGAVLRLAFSPDGKTLAAGGHGRVLLWDLTRPPGSRMKESGGRAGR